ncbi:MAG: hypothetical protein CVV51_00830 [Spirochaetae bacterium HGW-Spirochaetae-7]|jgi:phosphate:Na+ symporter|nr:MAG: hypothetical protein CVV51_00830 [Spirochaetae bacterium HGW-Spirochaetae-7]
MLDASMRFISGRDSAAKKEIRNDDDRVDTLRREIVGYLAKVTRRSLTEDEGLDDVMSLCAMVTANFRLVMVALESDDVAKAREVLSSSDRSWQVQRELRRKHFRRLNDGLKVSVETTEIHMDLLNDLHRINRHVYHIAQTLVEIEEEPATDA